MTSTETREISLGVLEPTACKFKELLQDVHENGNLSTKREKHTHLTSNYNPFLSRLRRDRQLDSAYRDELFRLRNHGEGIAKERTQLPVYNSKGDIIRAIENNRVVLITGETGCGKTTQVPQFVLDNYIEQGKGSVCRIFCCQPRKLSAAGVAQRVAEERLESVGGDSSVGYKIRFDDKSPRKRGSILYCTTGILQNLVANNNSLSFCSHIIIDEVHERRIEVDFLLTILRELFRNNPNCKVHLVLMSATIKPKAFQEYFDNCPIIEVPGITYPVEKYMLEDVLEFTKYQPTVTSRKLLERSKATTEDFIEEISDKYSPVTIDRLCKWDETLDYELILSLVKYICAEEGEGAILIFLPGWDEIHHLRDLIGEDDTFKNSSKVLPLVLHSRIPIVNQKEVFIPPPRDTRKIIISTSIAESGVTIDDVVFVIDSGFVKVSNFDVETTIESLDLEWISKASARQRRGRAGRTRPGKCYHLFTSHRESILEEFQAPEMVHSSLETYSLQVKSLQLGSIENFYEKVMDSPDPEAVKLSIALLQTLQCLDESENLTPLGSVVGQLPLHPKLGKMLLFGAIFSCLGPILTIVSVLESDDPFFMPKELRTIAKEAKEKLSNNSMSDHVTFARAYDEWENSTDQEKYCKENFLAFGLLVTISKHRTNYCRYLYRLGFIIDENPNFEDSNKNSRNEELVKAIVCAGLYPNIAYIERTSDYKRYRTKERRVRVHPWSVLEIRQEFTGRWLVYYKRIRTKGLNLKEVSLVRPMSLLLFGANIDEISTSQEEVMLNDWIMIRSPTQSMELLKEIRKTFLAIIDKIILDWKIIDWGWTRAEMRFIKAIIEHISYTKPRSSSASFSMIVESE